MTEERRYDEDEIREIFDQAASASEGPLQGEGGPSAGLSLPELQSIGREVGIPPERIADAAGALERRGVQPPSRTLLGAPLSVGRTVALSRAPTDREWELLVAELRQTFGARGRVEAYGSTREWSNGNLHALIEPTDSGHRLRICSLKGSAVALTRAGGFLLALGVVLLAVALAFGGAVDAPVLLSVIGAGVLGSSALRLRSWARERDDQMERIADRVRGLLETPSE